MSFGVGQAMSSSVKANLRLKGKRSTYFERTVEKRKDSPLIFSSKKKFSNSELIAFRTKIKREKRLLFMKRMLLTTSVMSMLAILTKVLNNLSST